MPVDVCADMQAELATAFNNVISGDEWPDHPDACLVLGSPSPQPRSTFSQGYSWHDVYFTVYCRDQRHGDARTKALAVRDALHELSPLPSVEWISVEAVSEPLPLGRTDDGHPYYSVDFKARTKS